MKRNEYHYTAALPPKTHPLERDILPYICHSSQCYSLLFHPCVKPMHKSQRIRSRSMASQDGDYLSKTDKIRKHENTCAPTGMNVNHCIKKRCAAIFALEEYITWIFYTVLWVCVHVFYRSEQAVIKYIRTKHVLHVHTQNPLSISPHSLVYQFITILRGPYHSLCLCCKLGIKHAPASGSTEGLAKGNLSHLTAGCLPAE